MARGGPYEAVAELELARCYLMMEEGQQALEHYEPLYPRHEWLACVLHSEMGVACAMLQTIQKAIGHFEEAVRQTTPEAMAILREAPERRVGPVYWACRSTVDNLASRQCQNHAWLAGLYAVAGNTGRSRHHLAEALRHLRSDEPGPAAPAVKRQFVEQMESMFPAVAAEPEVQALRRELD